MESPLFRFPCRFLPIPSIFVFEDKFNVKRRASQVLSPHLFHIMNRKLKLWELQRLTVEEFKGQPKFPLVVVLDDIRSFNNVGSFFRTADAFNIEQIFLCGITPCPPHREIQKTALGATETVDWQHAADILQVIRSLKDQGYCVCVVEQAETTLMLNDIDQLAEEKFALVFGNEVDGVNQKVIDLCDRVIEIPQFGTKHSLNVSVCGGVVMWEFAKKWIK
jgi:tRNA G18 (ribose-2'-O)-methylase SpoU